MSEVKRVVKRGGVRGLDVANTLDMPPLYDPYWNPLWDVIDYSRDAAALPHGGWPHARRHPQDVLW